MSQKILVIDDDHLVVKTIGKLLEAEGYEVITSESGQEALTIIENDSLDLVISDIRMPGMNGVETINVKKKGCQARIEGTGRERRFSLITNGTDS